MEVMGKIFSVIIIVIVSTIVGGFVVMKLWNWYMPEIFGIKELTLIQAIAVSFFVGYFKTPIGKREESQGDMEEIIYRWLGVLFVYYPLILLFGWIIHSML